MELCHYRSSCGFSAVSLAIGLCALLVSATAMAQQELSLPEQIKRAAQENELRHAESAGQESLAEQAHKARQNRPAPTSADGESLGEAARQMAQQRIMLLALGQLRLRSLVHFDLAPTARPAMQEPGAELAQSNKKSRPTEGATPAARQFSISQIFHRGSGQSSVSEQSPVTPSPQPQPVQPVAAAAVPESRLQNADVPPVAADKAVQAPPQPATAEAQAAVMASTPAEQTDSPVLTPRLNVQTAFPVKYVAEGSVYLTGGHSAGLAQGMKLSIKRGSEAGAAVIADLEVVSVADTSAVCEVKNTSAPLHAGDIAYLSQEDAEVLAQTRAMGGSRKYPQVVTFSEGDPLDEEAREEVPRPPLPEINRARGRIGLDYSGIRSGGSAASSSYQIGGVMRADITRIGGTYWNLSGYWRGRFNNSSYAGEPTLQDLINRTYHLSLTYDNPKSPWVAGFGRLYLPWASSLDTIDGGYAGRRLGHGATAGIFAGSTPDPTSWDYNPDRRIAGTFINFEGGSFDGVHYSSTSGVALTSLQWVMDRPFVFFENGIFYQHYLSIYQSLQADDPRPMPGVVAAGPGLSRSYTTVRLQPLRRLSFDFNHNYFRDVPTFSQQLISTGLLDKYLFQGFSAGVRVEAVRHITVYTDLGRSNRTGDQKSAINQLYGITFDRIWKTGLRADLRASKFDGSFGSGSYRSLSLSRNFGERVHWQVQAGKQVLTSSFTSQGDSKFVNSSLDASFGRHYFMQGDYTTQRGAVFDYDQWILTFGYRFDNRSKIGGGQ